MKNDKKSSNKKSDPRAERTRQWLQDSMLELLHEKSYSSIKISDIADRAGVSRQTLYLHYYNKKDLMLAVLERVFTQFHDELILEAHKQPFDPERFSNLIFSFWNNHRATLKIILDANFNDALFQKLRDIISEVVTIYAEQEGANRGEMGNYVADFLGAGAIAMLRRWLTDSSDITPATLGNIVGTAATSIASKTLSTSKKLSTSKTIST